MSKGKIFNSVYYDVTVYAMTFMRSSNYSDNCAFK